jgi:hypothetical protein
MECASWFHSGRQKYPYRPYMARGADRLTTLIWTLRRTRAVAATTRGLII